MHKYKLGEVASLKRALKTRDMELGALQARLDDQRSWAGGEQDLSCFGDAVLIYSRGLPATCAPSGQQQPPGHVLVCADRRLCKEFWYYPPCNAHQSLKNRSRNSGLVHVM